MEEYSRILTEDYCMNHTSAKSKRLQKLVNKSYDLNAEYAEADRPEEKDSAGMS